MDTDTRFAWIELEKKKIQEKRQYPHLDPIVKLDKTRQDIIFNPNKIVSHSFCPLIRYAKKERRRKADNKDNIRKIVTKERPISYSSHLDAMIYSWYSYILLLPYEKCLIKEKLDKSVLAYRKLKQPSYAFAKEVADAIQKRDESAVLCLDIASFFDKIDHNELKENWIKILSTTEKSLPKDHFKIFKLVTKYSYVLRKDIKKIIKNATIPIKNGRYLPSANIIKQISILHKKLKSTGMAGLIHQNQHSYGIPQGLPISGTLANISMLKFDIAINAYVKKNNGIYRRYSDDILIVIDKMNLFNTEDITIQELKKIGLEINPKKTEKKFFTFDNIQDRHTCYNLNGKKSHLQYLGIEFDGKKFYIRSQSVARFIRKIKRTIRKRAYIYRKQGHKNFKYRQVYEKYGILKKSDKTFLTYAFSAHKYFGKFSKINQQINVNKIKQMIKRSIQSRMPQHNKIQGTVERK